ncbi:hypothetical protein WOLCODRAFT_47617, partial [Wolfiporia cocos MD-104 SS10]
ALILYQYITTLDFETQFAWKTRMSGTNIILLFNRYFLLLNMVANTANQFGRTTPIVEISSTHDWLTTNPDFCRTAFSALRTYAIVRGKWHLALLVLALGLVPAATNIKTDVWDKCSSSLEQVLPRPQYGREHRKSIWSIHPSILIATRTCAIVSDVMVIMTTLHRTFSPAMLARQAQIKNSLFTLLLKDG